MFANIEMLFKQEESGESLLETISRKVTGHVLELSEGKKWKFQRENFQADCNIFVIAYVIPLILAYEHEMSEVFSEKLLREWNDTFHTNMKAGSYEQICSGFRTGIFGISFGERK